MSSITTMSKNKEFSRAYKKGKSFVSPLFVMYISRNYNKNIRLGITTSKKIGKAVYRNRARRIIKESFRQILPQIRGNFDIVFVARAKTPYAKTNNIKSKMYELLEKANILKDEI